MKKTDVIRAILGDRLHHSPQLPAATAFAATNIALCKYWGKRDQELNLPVTSSLSISLGKKGANTTLRMIEADENVVVLNGVTQDSFSNFNKKLRDYLLLYGSHHFHIEAESNIPIAAGLASSACGFAALVKALNQLFDWQCDSRELSILARLGSGSASRSIWPGFVEWHAGVRADGMDSYGEMLPLVWPDLCIGLVILSDKEKPISSRVAMQRTVETSLLYKMWPEKVKEDLVAIKEALHTQDFQLLGKTAESNALAMHATMLSAWPPVNYCLPETVAMMHKIWQLRGEGLHIYFTQDAGPNLKLLFLEKDMGTVRMQFPEMEIVRPFSSSVL